LGPNSKNLLNPLIAAQNFEYKMNYILDKPMESMFGLLGSLPDAFCAYRYVALLNGPLEKYFFGRSVAHLKNTSLAKANMYLAEDRILCYELVTKKDEKWLLRYVQRAKASTSVPETIERFVGQRRRWLNGSFFANIHAFTNVYQVFHSGHSPIRKLLLCIFTLYNVLVLLFNWFAIGGFFLVFYFLTSNIIQDISVFDI
jgi:chitin synthase